MRVEDWQNLPDVKAETMRDAIWKLTPNVPNAHNLSTGKTVVWFRALRQTPCSRTAPCVRTCGYSQMCKAGKYGFTILDYPFVFIRAVFVPED